ncbi:tail fiber domain-containing protein [Bradyrhizobium sp.]|uniref:tail fiber domain-containing protein n=1 Tax=Bradyrhizobium sp. TaxID=376 RepID=UPI003C5C4026
MGQSSSTTSQQSSTQPWAAAGPEVSGLLGQLGNLIPNSGTTSAQTGAINQLTAAGQAGNPYATGTTSAVNNLLSGGGATSQVPAVQQGYQTLQSELAPYTSSSYSTVNSPQVQAALQAANTGITNQVNGEFAAAGRSGSGYNTQTLAQGEEAADAPIILNQANTDTQTQLAADNALYGAGNTTANTVAGMNQQGVTNQNAGINNVGTALTNSTWGPQTTIAAQELGQSIPAQNLGLLAQIGIPLAQLGTNSSGTSNTQNNPSLISDLTGLGGLFSSGAGGTSAAAGMGQAAAGAGSGLLGLLGMI